jgi:hypothetical protein
MSFVEVIDELPRLSVEQRQRLIRRALELDDLAMTPMQEALIEGRLAAHHAAPKTSLSRSEMKRRLRSRR